MATRVIDDTKLNNIAVAIQAKDGGGQMTVDEMPGRIEAIPTGSPTVLNPALVLWDWEGTKLAEYSAEDALALTELPTPSTLHAYADVDHELLLFQKWNCSLANIKTWIQNHRGGCLDVGANYTTTDGLNHNYWGNPRLNTVKTINMQKRGIASIADFLFQDFCVLTQVNIPDGATSIGYHAFYSCCHLAQVNIPDGVTSIEESAFTNCYLAQISVPNSITSIGSFAFQCCYHLARVNIPDSVTNIGEGVFYSCIGMTSVTIPDSVTSIGRLAFFDCHRLAQVNIPDSVTNIGDQAFRGCETLCDVLLESKPTLASTTAFYGLPTNYRIYVPRANLSWFETETNWSTIYTQGHIVVIEDYIDYLESIGFNVDKYKEAA
jgi:hypothetical protein